jgi:phosphoribosylglycinamide formyltransferase-1
MRTAILISGRGSNMKALIAFGQRPNAGAGIALVVSNRPEAGGIEIARAAGIETAVIDHRAYPDRGGFEQALDDALTEAGIELVCLAGFMRLLSPWFVERWRDRLLNIHPSLLPAFKGLHTHERALAAGVRVHGCSVHLVRAELDDGPILVQGVVPVRQDDTEDSLAARVLEAEHRCYPLALDLMASGNVRIDGDRLTITGGTPPIVSLINP